MPVPYVKGPSTKPAVKRKIYRKNNTKPAPIDRKVIEKMAYDQCSAQEMADFFGVSVMTIYNRFRDVLTKHRARRSMMLRETQLALAAEGNVTMLIWLGKQYLGQADKVESKNEELGAGEEQAKDLKKLSIEELAHLLELQKKMQDTKVKQVESTVQKSLPDGSQTIIDAEDSK